MINFDYYANKNKTEHNQKWLQVQDPEKQMHY